jgi:hypothetical protein
MEAKVKSFLLYGSYRKNSPGAMQAFETAAN